MVLAFTYNVVPSNVLCLDVTIQTHGSCVWHVLGRFSVGRSIPLVFVLLLLSPSSYRDLDWSLRRYYYYYYYWANMVYPEDLFPCVSLLNTKRVYVVFSYCMASRTRTRTTLEVSYRIVALLASSCRRFRFLSGCFLFSSIMIYIFGWVVLLNRNTCVSCICSQARA